MPAVAHVRLTWVTRLFCPASRRESLPLATIWSFYLHLAGESQKYKLRAGETLTGVCWSFYDHDGGIFILAWRHPPPPPLPSATPKQGEKFEMGGKNYLRFLDLSKSINRVKIISANIPMITFTCVENITLLGSMVMLMLNSFWVSVAVR